MLKLTSTSIVGSINTVIVSLIFFFDFSVIEYIIFIRQVTYYKLQLPLKIGFQLRRKFLSGLSARVSHFLRSYDMNGQGMGLPPLFIQVYAYIYI